MTFLLIANLLSFVSACFTAASSVTKDPRRTYQYQVRQTLVYAAAAFFFGVYSTIVMMLLNTLRNYLVGAGKFTRGRMLVIAAAALIFGLVTNGTSVPGFLSVLLTVSYTVTSFYLTGAKAVKVNVAVNLMLWFVYDLLVRDVPSGLMDIIGTALALHTLYRLKKEERTAP